MAEDPIVEYDPVGDALGLYGGDDIEFPEMSDEEKKLLATISESMGYGLDALQDLMPGLMREARIVPASTPEQQARINEIDAEIAQLTQKVAAHYSDSDAYQNWLTQVIQPQIAALNREKKSLGAGQSRQQSYDEYLDSLDPDQRENELIKQESRQNLIRLLSGREDAVPALDATFDKMRQETHTQLIRAGIQPGSQGYVQAMAEVERNVGLTELEARESIFGMSLSGAAGVPAGPNYAGALSAASIAMGAPASTAVAAYANQRTGQYEASVLNQQLEAQSSSGALELIGSGVGLAVGG